MASPGRETPSIILGIKKGEGDSISVDRFSVIVLRRENERREGIPPLLDLMKFPKKGIWSCLPRVSEGKKEDLSRLHGRVRIFRNWPQEEKGGEKGKLLTCHQKQKRKVRMGWRN